MTELRKCPFCGGEARTWEDFDGWRLYCTKCDMTNEEWFCSLQTAEKAKFMCNIYEMGKNGKEYFMRLDKAVEWLKEKHNEM